LIAEHEQVVATLQGFGVSEAAHKSVLNSQKIQTLLKQKMAGVRDQLLLLSQSVETKEKSLTERESVAKRMKM
jgi:hypothetical protein